MNLPLVSSMVNVKIYNNMLSALGHTDTQACARVSTVLQLCMKLLYNKITKKEVDNGITILEFDNKMTKNENFIYETICQSLIELSDIYIGTMNLEDNRAKEEVNTDGKTN